MTVSHEMAKKHYPSDREDFIRGMGKKTLDNYAELGLDPHKELGTSDDHEIGMMVLGWLLDMLTSGPVVAAVIEGPHSIEVVRKICGFTVPLTAAPGTIRGDFAFDSPALANKEKRAVRNLIHASGNREEAEYELKLWFPDLE